MNKVAIVSFYKSENYGAILQAVALQQAIASLGYTPCYLDYERKLKLSFPRRILNIVYSYIRGFLGYKKRYMRSSCFIRKFINVEQFIDEEQYDIYVVGSDQVWFPGYVSDFFLLSFIKKKKKISYASSFGISKLENSYHKYYYDCLSTFDAISTREEKGSEIVRSLGLESRVVVDPTLLFAKSFWLEKTVEPCVNGDYILCYVMNGDAVTANAVYEYAHKLSILYFNRCKVIVIGDKEYKKLIPGFNLICDAGPAEFLGYIKNATFIVTSSFHGTCFSILFEKDYINILRSNNPVKGRIEEINHKLGLDNRILYYAGSSISVLEVAPIDYKKVGVKLDALREGSINYLKESLR